MRGGHRPMIRVEESSRQTVVRSEQRDVAIRSTHGDHKAIVDVVVLPLPLVGVAVAFFVVVVVVVVPRECTRRFAGVATFHTRVTAGFPISGVTRARCVTIDPLHACRRVVESNTAREHLTAGYTAFGGCVCGIPSAPCHPRLRRIAH